MAARKIPECGSPRSVYMGVSDEYRKNLLEASLKRRLGDDGDLT